LYYIIINQVMTGAGKSKIRLMNTTT